MAVNENETLPQFLRRLIAAGGTDAMIDAVIRGEWQSLSQSPGHDESEGCWCAPRVERNGDTTIVVHRVAT